MRFLKLSVVFFIFLPLSVFSQKIPDIEHTYLVLESDNQPNQQMDYLLFVHSTHRCGYCRLLRRDMGKQELPDNMRMIFIEYDTPEEWILEADSSYLGAEVRRVSDTIEKQKVTFFPSSVLVRARDSSRVKRFKGYPYDFWEKTFKRTRR